MRKATRKESELLIAAALGIVTLALYAPSLGFPFLNLDDPVHVTENPHVRGGLTLAGCRRPPEPPAVPAECALAAGLNTQDFRT